MTWADDREVFRSVWADDLRLVIDGVDVTRLRGAPAEWSSYQLQEPFSFGPATFRFPQVSDLEIRSDPADLASDLTWMRKKAAAQIVPVVSGVAQAAIWRGFVTTVRAASGTVEVTCAGEASGRLSLNVQPVQLFRQRHDVGRLVYDALDSCGVKLTPRLGPTTGILLDTRGSFEDSLSYCSGLLVDAQLLDGTTWTVRRHATANAYEMVEKDLTTVHCTIFAGTDGVELDLSDDLAEQPNTLFGSGVDPRDGHKYVNGVVPGVITDEDPPPYPFFDNSPFGEGTTNEDTDTGDGILVMHARLISAGAMARADVGGGFDDETTDAVKIIQDRAGLTESGIMNTATWDALFDVTTSGYSLRGARVLPLAQNDQRREFNRTASGKIMGRNPLYDPSGITVARHVAHGLLKKRRARRWSRREINRLSGKNYVGTITLDGADVFDGDHTHGDPETLLSRFQIQAGWNILVKGFDGDTLFHIAGVNATADGRVTFAVDTQARDLRTVAEIVARNRESRRSRGREWRQEHRNSGQVHDAIVGWFEQGGELYQDVAVTADTWTVFPVVGGQEGTVAKLRLEVDSAAFAVAVFGEKVTRQWLATHIGDPFDVDADGNSVWLTSGQQNKLFTQRTLLYAAGTPEEPCGYWPKRHTNDSGDTTAAPVTGVHVDDGAFSYRTYGDGVNSGLLWVAVYALDDATVKAGRIMWQQIEEGF